MRTVDEYEAEVSVPGKFEGEHGYVPYFYDLYLSGLFSDINERDNLVIFNVTEEDTELFPELLYRENVTLVFHSGGFVNEV